MVHPLGTGSRDDLRLEFRGSQLDSDGGLLIVQGLDDALGLSDLSTEAPIAAIVRSDEHAQAASDPKAASGGDPDGTMTLNEDHLGKTR